MNLNGYGLSDKGCQREKNEDRFLVDNQSGLYIVADGMGGIQGGEVAAQIVIDELPMLIKASYKERSDIGSRKFQALVREDICSLSDSIYRQGVEIGYYDMGSTFVMLFVQEDTALIAHVGDSRCYRYNSDNLELLTNDHSCDTDSYQLTRVLGTEEIVHGDLKTISLEAKDLLLLCSDGLNHMISDDDITQVIKKSASKKICGKLIKKANEAGGEDNITCIAITV